jgi:hypothetical protein
MVVDVYGICGKYCCSWVMSMHHMHSCHEHVHRARSVRKSYNYSGVLWARSVRKLYDYSGVLLWIMSLTYGHDCTGTTSYVARGGVRCSSIPCWVCRQETCICIAFALFVVYMSWIFCWHEVEMRSIVFIMRRINLIIYGGGLFMVYRTLYFFMEILLDILCNVGNFFMAMSLDK